MNLKGRNDDLEQNYLEIIVSFFWADLYFYNLT